MMRTKLELTWIGKEDRPRLLLEDAALLPRAAHRVTEGVMFDNRLIYGDNLLALKALEQEFAGKVKCIYIDPPFRACPKIRERSFNALDFVLEKQSHDTQDQS